jgi:hypothetical protein
MQAVFLWNLQFVCRQGAGHAGLFAVTSVDSLQANNGRWLEEKCRYGVIMMTIFPHLEAKRSVLSSRRVLNFGQYPAH